MLKVFGFDQYQTELSTWDPNDRKNFLGIGGSVEPLPTARSKMPSSSARSNTK